MANKNSKQIIVELRAWVDHPNQVRGQIKEQGARHDHTKTFIDHYYGRKGTALNLLWEETGRAIRIREYGSKDCEVIRKEGVVTTEDGKFAHGASKMSVLFKGNLRDSKKFLEDSGYTQHLFDIKKTRETYTLNSMGICLDEFEQFGPAMEVILRVDKIEEIPEAKEKLLDFLKSLGVKDYSIESASITNRILVSQLSRDPEIKKAALEEQLKECEAKLKECLAKRGEAYVLGGDGWHDNPAFEALEAEYDFLQSRIRQTKNELLELRTKGVTFLKKKPNRGNTNWNIVADRIVNSELRGRAISAKDFVVEFCNGVDKSKGHILWALKGNIKAAKVVSDLIAIRYDGNQAWIFLKPKAGPETNPKAPRRGG